MAFGLFIGIVLLLSLMEVAAGPQEEPQGLSALLIFITASLGILAAVIVMKYPRASTILFVSAAIIAIPATLKLELGVWMKLGVLLIIPALLNFLGQGDRIAGEDDWSCP